MKHESWRPVCLPFWIAWVPDNSSLSQHYHWKQERMGQVQVFLTSHRAEILNYGKVAGAKLAAPVQKIWWLILIPILSLSF